MTSHNPDLQACCANLYGHPLVSWLLGNSLHPGGLELTGKMAHQLKLGSDDRVLDIGSGRGATAVYLARTIGCKVIGVTLEPAGIASGRELAQWHGVANRVLFLQGDFGQAPLQEQSFDAIVGECVLSILPDKEAALRSCYMLLRPGGRLGFTDVTVSGPLPSELDGLLAMAGCVGGAKSLEQYRQMAEGARFSMDHLQELPEVASAFLRDVSGRLLMAEAASRLGKLQLDEGMLHAARRLVSAARQAVDQGVVGYGLVVAHR